MVRPRRCVTFRGPTPHEDHYTETCFASKKVRGQSRRITAHRGPNVVVGRTLPYPERSCQPLVFPRRSTAHVSLSLDSTSGLCDSLAARRLRRLGTTSTAERHGRCGSRFGRLRRYRPGRSTGGLLAIRGRKRNGRAERFAVAARASQRQRQVFAARAAQQKFPLFSSGSGGTVRKAGVDPLRRSGRREPFDFAAGDDHHA